MVSGQGERERRAARSDQNGDGQDDREQYRTPGAGALDLRGRVPSLRGHGRDVRGRGTGLRGRGRDLRGRGRDLRGRGRDLRA